MAKPTVFAFKDFLIAVGDGNSPEVFGNPCGLTARSFAFSATTNDTNIPDCTDPEAPAWLGRDYVSFSGDITGSGILAEEFLPTWWAWKGSRRNVRIHVGTHVWEGTYLLTNLSISSNIGNKVDINVTMTSDGEIIYTP